MRLQPSDVHVASWGGTLSSSQWFNHVVTTSQLPFLLCAGLDPHYKLLFGNGFVFFFFNCLVLYRGICHIKNVFFKIGLKSRVRAQSLQQLIALLFCNTNNLSDINWLYAVGIHTHTHTPSAWMWPPYKLIIGVLSRWLCGTSKCVCVCVGELVHLLIWDYVHHKFQSQFQMLPYNRWWYQPAHSRLQLLVVCMMHLLN